MKKKKGLCLTFPDGVPRKWVVLWNWAKVTESRSLDSDSLCPRSSGLICGKPSCGLFPDVLQHPHWLPEQVNRWKWIALVCFSFSFTFLSHRRLTLANFKNIWLKNVECYYALILNVIVPYKMKFSFFNFSFANVIRTSKKSCISWGVRGTGHPLLKWVSSFSPVQRTQHRVCSKGIYIYVMYTSIFIWRSS